MKKIELAEYRCTCEKLLFKGVIEKGAVEVKCRGCRKITLFTEKEVREVLSPEMA